MESYGQLRRQMEERTRQAREQRERRRRGSVWSGEPNPMVKVIRSSDIGACPTQRLDVQHYRPDGTCMCCPPRDESLEPQIVRGED